MRQSADTKRLDCLLLVPPFWDPICVPLGPAALNAYVKSHGQSCDVFDFNTDPEIYSLQSKYFRELEQQFPRWRSLSVDRNATEILAIHQILYLRTHGDSGYEDMCRHVLGIGEWSGSDSYMPQRFDEIFASLFRKVALVLADLLATHEPRVLGLTLYNSTWPATCLIAQIARRLRPDLRIAVGGPGPVMGISSRPEDVVHFLERTPEIDYYVLGEGEAALLRILEDPDHPRGIVSADTASSPKPNRGLMSLHDLPDPDYGSLAVDSYLHLSVASARGCPYECSFCAETVFWQGFRSVKKSALLSRFDALASRYGKGSFYICDSLSNQAVGPLTDACLAAGRAYAFDCYLRADRTCASPSVAARWRAGGLKRARLGMESASQRILDDMVKHTDVQQMHDALFALAGAGIRTSTLWIVGYPGETEGEFDDTLRFIADNSDNIYQADAWTFQYSPAGLAGSVSLDARGIRPRFSAELDEVLGVQFYNLAGDLSTEERFDRLERFVRRMHELTVPNPYSLVQLRMAERRWSAMGRS